MAQIKTIQFSYDRLGVSCHIRYTVRTARSGGNFAVSADGVAPRHWRRFPLLASFWAFWRAYRVYRRDAGVLE